MIHYALACTIDYIFFLYGTINFITLKSIGERNRYIVTLHIIGRIAESVILFKSQLLYDQQVDNIILIPYIPKNQEW